MGLSVVILSQEPASNAGDIEATKPSSQSKGSKASAALSQNHAVGRPAESRRRGRKSNADTAKTSAPGEEAEEIPKSAGVEKGRRGRRSHSDAGDMPSSGHGGDETPANSAGVGQAQRGKRGRKPNVVQVGEHEEHPADETGNYSVVGA